MKKCQHVGTGGGYSTQPCGRDATHEVTYRLRPIQAQLSVTTTFVCRQHAPWKLAKRNPGYCQIEPINRRSDEAAECRQKE